jgi:hypothetical protein
MILDKVLDDKLTDKQRAFVSEYLKDFNATQAAIRAGYAESGARVEGHRLLTNANIRAEIERHFQDLGLTGERLLAEQMALAFADFGDYVQVDEGGGVQAKALHLLSPGKTKAIKKIKETRSIKENPDGSLLVNSTLEYELHDKQKALDALAKHISGREKLTAPDASQSASGKQPAQQMVDLLWHAIAQAQAGQLDPVLAKTTAALAATWLKAHEQVELEERLAILERTLKSQAPTSDVLEIDL